MSKTLKGNQSLEEISGDQRSLEVRRRSVEGSHHNEWRTESMIFQNGQVIPIKYDGGLYTQARLRAYPQRAALQTIIPQAKHSRA